MERETVLELIEGFENRPFLLGFKKQRFIRILESVVIDFNSSRFFNRIEDEYEGIINEWKKYHCLSLRGVLINKNASREVSLLKQIFGDLARTIGWSSKALSREVRLNKQLADALVQIKGVSLLAKLRTFDYDNCHETLFVVTRPVLIVPKEIPEEVAEVIRNWEEKNITYEEEVGFLFRHLKKIACQRYIDA